MIMDKSKHMKWDAVLKAEAIRFVLVWWSCSNCYVMLAVLGSLHFMIVAPFFFF